MKKNMNLKGMWLAVAALLAVSTMTASLTSCSKDDADATLYGQWETSVSSFLNLEPEYAGFFGSVVFDFSSRKEMKTLVKMKKTVEGYKEGQWYTWGEALIKVTENGKTAGTFISFEEGEEEGKQEPTAYSIKGNTMTITWESENGKKTVTLQAVSGIKSEGKFKLDVFK